LPWQSGKKKAQNNFDDFEQRPLPTTPNPGGALGFARIVFPNKFFLAQLVYFEHRQYQKGPRCLKAFSSA
jgi:hypothetical protein